MDTRRTEWEKIYMPNGHWIKYNVFRTVISSFCKNDTTCFDRSFYFNCIKMPTSWSFQVTFMKAKNGNLHCETIICRTDGRPGLVNVQFWTTIRINPVCFDVAHVQHFISRMRSGEADKELAFVIESKEARELYNEPLHVEFFFIVYGCHSAQDRFVIKRRNQGHGG